jgi:phage shock protein A
MRMDDTNVPGSDSLERDDTDIRGMGPEEARDYVLAFITSLKETQRQKEKCLEDLKLWQDRLRMAQNNSRPDLIRASEARILELRDQAARLNEEEKELSSKVTRLKEKMKELKIRFQFSVDTDLLLADLNMLVGEKDITEEKFKEEEARIELNELKRKLKEKESGE